ACAAWRACSLAAESSIMGNLLHSGKEGARRPGAARSRSVLAFGHGDFEAVHRFGDLDLATEPGSGAEIVGEVQHVLFGFAALAGQGRPGFVDVDVAGGTGALAAAVAVDARHRIVRGRFHQGGADRYV